MPTPWTAETLWPAQGEQIVAASLLARKARLEFELVARVILHQALHYILGSPESSGYPAYLNEIVNISEGDLVIDVGGHLGTFTRLALESGARKIVVFEPEPTNVLCLKRTFEKEILERTVVLIEAAAWDETTNLRFQVADADNSGTGQVATQGEIEVPAVTIDDTVADRDLDRVDFIKMDIEGAERHAVAGAHDTIARFAPRMALSAYHEPDDPEVISKLVLSARPTYQMKDAKAYLYFYE